MVDFHAEATSEKIAKGRFLDGKVSLVAGTHTHVTTADEQVFPSGTAYISDVDLLPQASVLYEIDPVIQRFLTLQLSGLGTLRASHDPGRFGDHRSADGQSPYRAGHRASRLMRAASPH